MEQAVEGKITVTVTVSGDNTPESFRRCIRLAEKLASDEARDALKEVFTVKVKT